MKYFILSLASLISFNIFAINLAIETDPSTFLFSGSAIHTRLQLDSKNKISFGFYSMKFPTIFQKLAIENGSSDNDLKLKTGFAFFYDRYLLEDQKGLYIGFQVAHQNYIFTNNLKQNFKYSANIFMPRIGYDYQIKNSNFYLNPWMGIGYLKTNTSNVINNHHVREVLPFGALHVGYSF